MPSKKKQEQNNNNPLKQVASVGLPLLSGAIGLVAIYYMVNNSATCWNKPFRTTVIYFYATICGFWGNLRSPFISKSKER